MKRWKSGAACGLCLMVVLLSGCGSAKGGLNWRFWEKPASVERPDPDARLSRNIGEPHEGKRAEKIREQVVEEVRVLKQIPEFRVSTVRQREVIRISVPARYLFDPNETALCPAGKELLVALLDHLKPPHQRSVLIAAYMDNTGSPAYLERITRKRAAAVGAWLQQRGIASERIVAYGKGNADPRKPNDSDANRAGNRRIDFYLLPDL